MAGCFEMKVSAFKCETCGVLAEKRHPRCVSHEVKTIQVTKRWFKCNQCSMKITTLCQRLPNRQCPKCKVYDFEACSMYSIKQDVMWEDNLITAGIADRSLLKVRGEEQKWVLR